VSTHPYTQPQIAQAVHQAVCTHTGTDGLRCGRFYAITGLLLLRPVRRGQPGGHVAPRAPA
jgi:hypothetical protein